MFKRNKAAETKRQPRYADAPNLDPGFLRRRVTRPNPLDRWDEDTQAAIARDFDALAAELRAEHRDVAARELDNSYASQIYTLFLRDEAKGRELLARRRGVRSFIRGVHLLGRSRFAQFCMGHEVLHGTYPSHSDPRMRGVDGWYFPLFIVDKHWRHGHNRFHHRMPGVFGLDPESSPANYRGSTDFYAERGDRLQVPFASFILAFQSLFFIGIVEAKKYAESDPDAWNQLLEKNLDLARKEFLDIPRDAGLAAPRVMLGNLLSFGVAEVISGMLGRSTHVRDESVCLHSDEFDPQSRAHFYITALINAGNVEYPGAREYIGGFDTHIEHHMFPFLSSRRLEDASDRVRALCAKYDLPYHEGPMWQVLLGGIFLDLKLLVSP